jgi:molybdopterin-binding protein
LVIRNGRLVAQGAPKETLMSGRAVMAIAEEQLENVFTVTFIDSDKGAGRARVRLATGPELFIPYLPQPVQRTFQIRVGADDILIGAKQPDSISAGNILSGSVRGINVVDGQALVTVQAGEEFFVRLTGAAVTRLGLKEGTPVFLIIKTRSFRVL